MILAGRFAMRVSSPTLYGLPETVRIIPTVVFDRKRQQLRVENTSGSGRRWIIYSLIIPAHGFSTPEQSLSATVASPMLPPHSRASFSTPAPFHAALKSRQMVFS